MKKRITMLIFILLVGSLVLTACGEKSQEKVTEKLAKKVEDLDSYKAKAEMKMNTGQDEQKYDIEVWYKQDDMYRVELANHNDEQESQVILKNEDGVFVLTPELNKSFKFQTDWPDNSSQAYLYHSLVNDILKDPEATFDTTDDYYVFNAKANYQSNQNMPHQEIYFDKKDFTPIMAKILDKDEEPIVEVMFTSFELNSDLADSDFEVEENMTSDEEESPVSGEENSETEEDVEDHSFEVLFPLYTAEAELADQKEVSMDNGSRVLMVFSGEKEFTLIQEKTEIQPAFSSPYEVKGDIINLGFTIGAISDHMIEWSYNGVDFTLASDELTEEELIDVAQSVQGKEVK